MEKRASRVRKNASTACQFCRIRKLRCDTAGPPCSACQTRGLECVYVRQQKNPRPSNQRIRALEEEIERLRRTVNERDGGVAASNLTTTPQETNNNDSGQFNDREHQLHDSSLSPMQGTSEQQASHATSVPHQSEAVHHSSPSGLQISATGRLSYHGPTSTLFETENMPRSADSSSISTERLRNDLVASTLRQRQKESLASLDASLLDGWDPELVLHLLNIHWNRQHHNLLLVYRPLFMRDMVSGGPYFSKLLLNALMFAAAKFSPRVDIRKKPDQASTAGWQFLARVKELLGEAMDNSTIPTIQALITVASSLFAIGDERSTSWLYSGTAFRMIVDLGLHIDGAELFKTGKLSLEDLEIRRRVFWGAFVFDKLHSMYQGRPVTLQERDIKVPVEFLDDYEELENWVPLEPRNYTTDQYPVPKHRETPTHSVTTFAAFCHLSIIMNRTINSIYAEKAFQEDENAGICECSHMLRTLQSIGHDLRQWWDNLQPWLRYEPWATATPVRLSEIPAPGILSLQCVYYIFVILVHRPYLSRGHLYPAEIVTECLFACIKAAMRIARLVRDYCFAYTTRRAPYFIAYSAYVAATMLIRVAARQTIYSSAHECLQICLRILQENEKINPGVKRANHVIGKLLQGTDLARVPSGLDTSLQWSTLDEPLSDDISLTDSEISSIIDAFCTGERDALVARRPGMAHNENHNHLTTWQTPSQLNVEVAARTPPQQASTASEMLQGHGAALHSNTTDVYNFTDPDAMNDIIFGLHGTEFHQWWPDFQDFGYT